MKAKWMVPAGIFCLACAAGILIGQEKEDRTLLSQQQMTAIINEVSGERALHHVLDLVPYQFVRPPSEYQGHFRESEVMAKFAGNTASTAMLLSKIILLTRPGPWSASCGRPRQRA